VHHDVAQRRGHAIHSFSAREVLQLLEDVTKRARIRCWRAHATRVGDTAWLRGNRRSRR
jgi:hypothetical protein